MVMGKRAQLFLLAAVIISAVVLSLGITANQARVNREPGSFEDISYEVTKEAGAVVNYEIFKDFDEDENLTDFVNKYAEDIRDRNADAEFIFIYGDSSGLVFKNYGSDPVTVDGSTVPGSAAPIVSSICSSTGCIDVFTDIEDFSEGVGEIYIPEDDEEEIVESINVTIGGGSVSFPISRHRQVIFVIQQEVDGENFVSIGQERD